MATTASRGTYEPRRDDLTRRSGRRDLRGPPIAMPAGGARSVHHRGLRQRLRSADDLHGLQRNAGPDRCTRRRSPRVTSSRRRPISAGPRRLALRRHECASLRQLRRRRRRRGRRGRGRSASSPETSGPTTWWSTLRAGRQRRRPRADVASLHRETCATAAPFGRRAPRVVDHQGKVNDYSPNSSGCTGLHGRARRIASYSRRPSRRGSAGSSSPPTRATTRRSTWCPTAPTSRQLRRRRRSRPGTGAETDRAGVPAGRHVPRDRRRLPQRPGRRARSPPGSRHGDTCADAYVVPRTGGTFRDHLSSRTARARSPPGWWRRPWRSRG
jgi:hypothetical protein